MIPTEHTKALARFPPVLQELIQAELAAGNSIVEIGGGFPAPPAGAGLRLATFRRKNERFGAIFTGVGVTG